MATATTSGILDLRHFSARQLRPLLEAEADLWERTLRWNYTGATELLLQYLDSQVLTGFATVANGTVTGFAFSVFEARKAVIGDAFSRSAFEDPTPSLAGTRELLTHLVELLRATPMLDRIESQLLLYPAGALASFFAREGFAVYPRLFLERDLSPASPRDASPARPGDAASLARPGDALSERPRDLTSAHSRVPSPSTSVVTTLAGQELTLRRWRNEDYEDAAGLIHGSYRGHVDARINDQYRSLHGSLRFLHNIVRFPGCGVFETQHSWVIADEAAHRLVAMILCSRVAPDVAHVTQLCVLPEARGRRLGRHLLEHCAAELTRAGYHAITLTVTESNIPAATLYGRLGFTLRHRFDSAVLELTP